MPRVSDYWNESDSFNNPKESQRQIALPRRFFGIDLVHTVEFSRIGRSQLPLFRVRVEAFLILGPSAAFGVRLGDFSRPVKRCETLGALA